MATRRYTREELLTLRSSPLVHKPEDLPAIEQWIEYVYVYTGDSREKLRIPHSESLQQQQQTSTSTKRQPLAKTAATGGDASPMGSFSTGVRPGLVSRTTGSKSGEDISLGPPKTMFPSSRNTPRPSDAGLTSANQTATGDEQDGARNRFLGERTNRRSVVEREGRDTRDAWTIVREKRAFGGNDDEHRQDNRNQRRDRDQDGERRNGHGERQEGRWGERRQNGDRQGGWRDRQGGDRDRRDRDWERAAGTEKAPEWMDDPAPPGGDDDLSSMGMPRNQEQFQKWKEAMSGKKATAETPEPAARAVTPPPKEVEPTNPMTTLKLEGVADKPFGSWGEGKSSQDSSSKPSAMKGKPSRFASMFKVASPKDDETFADPPPPATAPPINSAEDAAGFQRILQMLGGTGIAQAPAPETPSSPPGRSTSGGSKQRSRFTGFFDQTPKSPERMQSPPEEVFHRNQVEMLRDSRNSVEDSRNMFVATLPDSRNDERVRRDQVPSNAISPEPPMNGSREHGHSGRMNDIFLDGQQKPPSRGPATPDINIQNLLAAQRAQKSQAQDKNSQFLLNLLQEKGSHSASHQAQQQQAQQARQDGFPLWLDQPPNVPQEPHAPKPRGAPPPPGFIDEQLLRSGHGDRSRQEQPAMPEQRSSQRAPPGFYDEQALYFQQQQQQQQQRRNFAEQPQQHPQQQGPGGPGHTRRMSGHPMPPQMHMPPMHQFPPQGPPPDFLQSPQGPPGPGGQPPPPGFNPQFARHPPGFHGPPGMFQQPPPPQPPPQQRGDFPGGMVSPPPNVPPGFYAGPPGMHHPPPPPGFMGMRNPNEGVPSRGYEGHDGGMGPRR
ncbi:hypothetical protein BDY17DRAFT_23647 [Neohortaea acidophila]|uniref:Uncharacterized protein n=1 Tax=Neohortaea acidophila TaxID=245834 RepID=A0A6A6Q6S8_9PEZI|nr:uncharacterized protein BDY17DRAFT_23647 [Neohortaea acidophila]KAF2488090.1 hypothetical protein BDY17DRAFT_23647 [Neohortaea acidophila]